MPLSCHLNKLKKNQLSPSRTPIPPQQPRRLQPHLHKYPPADRRPIREIRQPPVPRPPCDGKCDHAATNPAPPAPPPPAFPPKNPPLTPPCPINRVSPFSTLQDVF